MMAHPFVPAKAGTQGQTHGVSKSWVPAFAGTNGEEPQWI
jgi:hypothetical protein